MANCLKSEILGWQRAEAFLGRVDDPRSKLLDNIDTHEPCMRMPPLRRKELDVQRFSVAAFSHNSMKIRRSKVNSPSELELVCKIYVYCVKVLNYINSEGHYTFRVKIDQIIPCQLVLYIRIGWLCTPS